MPKTRKPIPKQCPCADFFLDLWLLPEKGKKLWCSLFQKNLCQSSLKWKTGSAFYVMFLLWNLAKSFSKDEIIQLNSKRQNKNNNWNKTLKALTCLHDILISFHWDAVRGWERYLWNSNVAPVVAVKQGPLASSESYLGYLETRKFHFQLIFINMMVMMMIIISFWFKSSFTSVFGLRFVVFITFLFFFFHVGIVVIGTN